MAKAQEDDFGIMREEEESASMDEQAAEISKMDMKAYHMLMQMIATICDRIGLSPEDLYRGTLDPERATKFLKGLVAEQMRIISDESNH